MCIWKSFKGTGAFIRKFSEQFSKFQRKESGVEYFISQIAACNYSEKKKPPWEELSYGFSKYVENNFSPEHLWMVA